MSLRLEIAGVELFLCADQKSPDDSRVKPGYILYIGTPSEPHRKKIRNVIAFCLGNYLVYLGTTILTQECRLHSLSAETTYSLGNRAAELPTLPPAPLGQTYPGEVEEGALSAMVNAILAKYDDLNFGELVWAYWNAQCAPVDMAAAHFGSAIEALQRAYAKSHSTRLETKIVSDKAKWQSLKANIQTAIADAGLDGPAAKMLERKLGNLNDVPASVTAEKVLAELGIHLSPIERAAWKRRNMAAHGAKLEEDDTIPVIRETKLLSLILHRMILKITGASQRYHDYYTLGHPIRAVLEPVPSEPS